MTQKCNKCKELKTIELFSLEPHPGNPNYRRKVCMLCRSDADKKRKEESGFYKKQYRSMTQEQRAEYIKKKSEQNQYRFKTNPEALARKKAYDKSDKGIYNRYRGECNRRNRLVRGITMELNFDQFSGLINRPCHYCGITNCRGVDRIDSNGNYTTNNTNPCCKVCNEMKSDRTEQQFIDHLKKITKHKGL